MKSLVVPDTVPVDIARDWLAERGFSLISEQRPSASDAPLDRIASEIGDQLELLGPLLYGLRRVATSGRSWTVDLRGESPITVTGVKAMALELHRVGLLSYCRYEHAATLLHLRVALSAASFLCGEWLERWVATRCRAAIASSTQACHVLRRVRIRSDDGQDAELDVVVMGRDGVQLLDRVLQRGLSRPHRSLPDIARCVRT